VLRLVESLGFHTYHPGLLAEGQRGGPVILDGLEEFREHLGGELTVTLVPEVGRKLEVHEMDPSVIVAAMEELKERSSVANQGVKS
jgi:3-dehydroquinate synthase